MFHAVAYALHLLAAVSWVGGLCYAWGVLRPASAAVLPGARLALYVPVLQRFLCWAWVAGLLLPASGMVVLRGRFNGFETAPRDVQWMMGGYIVMAAVFIRVHSLRLPLLRSAVAAEDWPTASQECAQIRHWLAFNLALGVMIVALGAFGPR